MVAGLTPGMALRDVVFAAGLGMLLCVGYALFGLATGYGRAARFAADFLVLTVGALLLRSAAMSRFYAGVVRWYTLLACVGAFCLCNALMGPVTRRLRLQLGAPVCGLVEHLWRPLRANAVRAGKVWRGRMLEKREDRRARRRKNQKLRLPNAGQVLYNSNNGAKLSADPQPGTMQTKKHRRGRSR